MLKRRARVAVQSVTELQPLLLLAEAI